MKNAMKQPRPRLFLDLTPDYFIGYADGKKVKTFVSSYSLGAGFLAIKYDTGKMRVNDPYLRIIGAALLPDYEPDHLTPAEAVAAVVKIAAADPAKAADAAACISRNADFDAETVAAARSFIAKLAKADDLSKRDIKHVADVLAWIEAVAPVAADPEAVADPAPAPVAADPEAVAELRKYDPEKADKYARIIRNIAAPAADPEAVADPAPEAVADPAPEAPAPVAADSDPASAPAPVAADPAPEAPAPAPAAYADKSFIGTAISGRGYTIIFDSATDRTRVIIAPEAVEALAPVVAAAGFYYSAAMNSYNKRLTCKAHRAALALAAELDKLAAA